jgi:hypothetical protein
MEEEGKEAAILWAVAVESDRVSLCRRSLHHDPRKEVHHHFEDASSCC